MRFLFCSLESPGFLFPSIGIALALARRGHDVAFASDLSTSERLMQAGLERLPRGDKDGKSFLTRQWFQPTPVAIQVKHIEHALRSFPADVLVGQALTLGPLLAAERCGLPVGILGFCTYLWPLSGDSRAGCPELWAHCTWRLEETLRLFNEARTLHRLPLLSREMAPRALSGDLLLIRNIAALQPDRDLWPENVHLTGSCLWEPEETDDELAEWLSATSGPAGPPLVYVQPARSFHLPSFWPALVASAATGELRIAAAIDRMDGTVGELPPNVFARPVLPQSQVLRAARAVVASATSTAVLGALAAGIPCLLIPGGGEQPDVAALCERAGVARTLSPQEATTERLSAELGVLLSDPGYLARAEQCRRQLALVDGPARAADLLQELGAAAHRSPHHSLGSRSAEWAADPAPSTRASLETTV